MQYDELLKLAAQAAVTNPFSEERDVLDHAILNTSRGHLSPEAVLARLVDVLSPAFSSLTSKGDRDISLPLSPEAPPYQHLATLFFFFHRHLSALDAHVHSALKASSTLDAEGLPLLWPKPTFAQALCDDLVLSGASRGAANHQVALFHQMRRAYVAIASCASGKGQSLARLRENLWNAIFTARLDLLSSSERLYLRDFPVLLTGPTGTGKSTAARVIGMSRYVPFEAARMEFSQSSPEPLVAVNVNALTETLFESELFGHRKGAFTGALNSHEGLLAKCGRGDTLFLDEIGDLPERQQTKLLEVLQERSFRPVGETRIQRFEGRIITATHRDPQALIASGLMREDFFYRICVVQIEMPSLHTRLRENPLELQELVGATLTRALQCPVDDETLQSVCSALIAELPPHYLWPGNVRELEQVVRGIFMTGRASFRRIACAPKPLFSPSEDSPALEDVARKLAANSVTFSEMEAALARAYFHNEGSYEKAARKAGVNWRTLKRFIA